MDPNSVPEDEVWFRYTRTAGRISAVPVNAKGWAVLVAAIVLPVLVTLASAPALTAVHPLLFVVVLALCLGLSFWILFRLVLAKGRPAA